VKHPVALGESGYNLLCKKDVFRVVLLLGIIKKKESADSLILEAEDGSYKCEIPFENAIQDGVHLIFEYYVKDRDKQYFCYFNDESEKLQFESIATKMTKLTEAEEENSNVDQS